jgi:hypothetical protein
MLEGNFDFNKTPMAPPGTKVILHEKPQQRKSWDPHGAEGWYLGPALEHYRCYRVFVNKTKPEQVSDAVEFFPQHTVIPYQTPTNVAIQATKTLIEVLSKPAPSTPIAHIGHDQMTAIKAIADLFNQHAPKETTIATTSQGTSPRVPVTSPTSLRVPVTPLPTARRQPQRIWHAPPRVPITDPGIAKQNHRYPTRNIIPYTQEEINRIQNTIQPTIHQWANAIIDPDTGASMKYRHLIKSTKHRTTWLRSFSNKIGRLAQGIAGQEKGTNTIFFIKHNKVSPDRRKDVTYGRICVNY